MIENTIDFIVENKILKIGSIDSNSGVKLDEDHETYPVFLSEDEISSQKKYPIKIDNSDCFYAYKDIILFISDTNITSQKRFAGGEWSGIIKRFVEKYILNN